MAREISALELRKRFGEIIEDVRYRKEPYIVKRNGRPMVVIVDIEAYQAVQQQMGEEAFVESYTAERVREFMKEDVLDEAAARQVRKALKR